MTKLKLLSAALIATAMITTPAMARKNHVTSRHLVEDANASITSGARNSDERHCHLAPRVGAFATQPWENGPPCEPALAQLESRELDYMCQVSSGELGLVDPL